MRGSISCISNCHRNSIASTVRTGDAYAWTGHFNTNVTGTANGLNQLTSVGPKSLTHDSKGNVTAFGTKSFTYSSENLLLTGPGSTTLGYDPAMRLYESVSGGTTQRMAYDGLDRIAEYDGSNALQRRYIHGPGMDEPLVQYEGSGTTDRRFLSGDDLGSVISLTDSAGALIGINKYDEFGNPQATNLGAFGYTGQPWLSGPGIWYYKARVYEPELGRFLQTDPIGYEGGINLYAYVGSDPVNWTDPLGLRPCLVYAVDDKGNPLPGAGPVGDCNSGSGQGSGSLGGAASGNPQVNVRGGSSKPKPKPQRKNPACTGGRITLGGQFSVTGFLATLGLNGNVEVGIAIPAFPSSSWNPFAGVQIYGRAQGLGLAGGGFFAGAGVSGVGGISRSPLTTGVQTSLVVQGGFADPGGGEVSVSLDGASVSAGPRAGMGGYLAGGAGKTATLATSPLGCP